MQYARTQSWPDRVDLIDVIRVRQFLAWVGSRSFEYTAGNGSFRFVRSNPSAAWPYYRALRRLFNWALEEGYLKSSPLATIEVTIDIKPGSNPNSIKLESQGMVPVAVLTTDDFDASIVDPDTVEFADAEPVSWTTEDVDGDGDLDMLFHFKTQELDLTEASTEATLTGETIWDNPILGTDTVNIVPKGKDK